MAVAERRLKVSAIDVELAEGVLVVVLSHDQVVAAQFPYLAAFALIDVETHQVAGVAVNHGSGSALTSATISSIDRSPGFGARAPDFINRSKSGWSLRFAQ